ncbi:ABC transporter substrate-binding protein [Peribacillus sp. SCS-37]|uniref:ABC transporter substrate-binding protein n=1 Tax=Paraperibacillus esterisolvens TaxID=3115296 RepID=UPI003906278F
MKPIEHYLQMRLGFLADERDLELSKSLDDIASILCCSRKNAKRVLRRLQEEGLLTYSSGAGRGNKSKILFQSAIHSFLSGLLKEYFQAENYEAALSLIKLPLPPDLKESLTQKLQLHFNAFSRSQTQDILRLSLKRKLLLMDPAFVSISTESHLIRQIYSTLVVFDRESNSIKPHLAHAWEYDSMDKTWIFYIRKGIKFHSGRSLTSEDIAFTFRRLKEIDSPNNWLLEDAAVIETPSPWIIKIRLNRDNALFLHYLSSPNASILPSGRGFSQEHIIGCGPYAVKSLNDHALILEAFDGYFKERAYIDTIEIWFIPEAEEVLLDFELPGMGVGSLHTRQQSVAEVGCTYIGFNFNKPGIMHDLFFRKAMYELADQRLLIEELKKEARIPAASFFPWISSGRSILKSMERAKNFLAMSGYNGEVLSLYYFNKKESSQDAIWLKERCRQAGIALELLPFSINTFYEETDSRNGDMILMGEIFQEDHHLSFIAAFKNSSCFISRFLAGSMKEAADRRISRILAEPSAEVRQNLIQQMEEWIMEEDLFIFNYHTERTRRYHGLLEGVALNSFGWANFNEIWIKPELMS